MSTLVNIFIGLLMSIIPDQPAEEKKAPPLDEPNTSVEIKQEKSIEEEKVYNC